jgi:hypothetical protein
MPTTNDDAGKLLALLASPDTVALPVFARFSASWTPENVVDYRAWETTRESQLEHYAVRVEIDRALRSDGDRPNFVGFEEMMHGLKMVEASTLQIHLLRTRQRAFLVITDVGTTRIVGFLWEFEDGVDEVVARAP